MPAKKPCAKSKVRNPKSNRCVKKDGAIGRRVQGKPKKSMDTPALRRAIAKERARGKKAFTIKKKAPTKKKPAKKAPAKKKPAKKKPAKKAPARKEPKGNEMLGGVGLEEGDKRDSVMKVGNSYEYKSGDGRYTYTFKKGKTFKGARVRWGENTFWRAKVLEILPNFKMKVLIAGFQTPANTRETTKYKRDFFRKEIIASFKRGDNKDSGNMGTGIYNPNEIYLDLDGIRETIGEVFLKKATLNKSFGIDKRSQEDKKKYGNWG
jgi:hypothetical protein